MAFDKTNLVLAWFTSSGVRGVGAATVFDYSTTDGLSAIETGGGVAAYFYPDPLSLRAGDIIRVTASDGKAVYVVAVLNGGSGARIEIIKIAAVDTFPTTVEEYGGGDGL